MIGIEWEGHKLSKKKKLGSKKSDRLTYSKVFLQKNYLIRY